MDNDDPIPIIAGKKRGRKVRKGKCSAFLNDSEHSLDWEAYRKLTLTSPLHNAEAILVAFTRDGFITSNSTDSSTDRLTFLRIECSEQ